MTWITRIVPSYGPDDHPILTILAKRTYRFKHGAKAQLDTSEPLPFFDKDEYYHPDKPFRSALKHEQELVGYKPLCDVILHACAHPPPGRHAFHLDCGIKVDQVGKLIRAFGDRKVFVKGTGLGFSDPEPYTVLRLDYGNAYGGASPSADKSDGSQSPVLYPRNPVGKGFAVGSATEIMQGLALPNLEDPENLLTPTNVQIAKFEAWRSRPEPAAFGYVPRQAYPRWQLAGMDKIDWLEAEGARKLKVENAPEVGAGHDHLPPPSRLLNPEFYNGAPPGLRFPHLTGGEAVKLRYLDAEFALLEFDLPGDKPAIWIDIGRGRVFLPPVLQTVEIFSETRQCTLLWRGSARYGGPESLRTLTALDFGAEEA
jgi:hypothetical protein